MTTQFRVCRLYRLTPTKGVQMSEPRRVLILGAAGRDFHNFNTYYRDNADFKWTLETVGKYIDEDLSKLTKKGGIKILSL